MSPALDMRPQRCGENEMGDAVGMPNIPIEIPIKDIYNHLGNESIKKEFRPMGFAEGECTIEFFFEEVK